VKDQIENGQAVNLVSVSTFPSHLTVYVSIMLWIQSTQSILMKIRCLLQGFQYFSSVSVLQYLQAVIWLKLEKFSWISNRTLFKSRRYQRPF